MLWALAVFTAVWVLLLLRSIFFAGLGQSGAIGEFAWKDLISLGRHVGVMSIQGRREHMEDTFQCISGVGNDAQAALFAVYDGHGGDRASAFAAQTLHQLVLEQDFRSDPEGAIRKALARLDRDWMEMATAGGWEDGTTVILGLVVNKVLYVANVGDSRAVLASEGAAIEMSHDHKPDRPDERKRIEALGGRIVFYGTWRVEGQLAVTRAVGDRRLKRYVTSEPEIMRRDLRRDDQFIILASDGLWDVLTNQEAVDTVYQCSGVKEAAKALTELAYQQNSHDNITCMVVDLRPFR